MRKPSPPMIVALLALFVSLSGIGVAATGGNFILGELNTADQQTQLTGTVNGNPQLRVQNAATSGVARAIVGKMTSASAPSGTAGVLGATASTDPGSVGVIAQNTGGGPALSAVVNAGVAPFKVNSDTKVANLNADKLDGSDATDFFKAQNVYISKGITLNPGSVDTITVADGIINIECGAISGGTIAIIDVQAGTEVTENGFGTAVRSDGTYGTGLAGNRVDAINIQYPYFSGFTFQGAAFTVTNDDTGDTISGIASGRVIPTGLPDHCEFTVTAFSA